MNSRKLRGTRLLVLIVTMSMPVLQGCDTKDALSFMKQLEPYVSGILKASSGSKSDSTKKPKNPSDDKSKPAKEPKSPSTKLSGGSEVASNPATAPATDRKVVKDGAEGTRPPNARTSEGGGSFDAPLLDPLPSRYQ